MMTKTADEHNAEIIANAVYYGVSIFLGGGQHDSHTCRTLEEARETAARMAEHYRNGRKPLIYAFDKMNRHALVTE
jgi:hypothetical protein